MSTKVQKKTKNASISVLIMLEQENIKAAFIEALINTVIFYRIEDVMFRMHNIYAPSLKKGLDWEAEEQFTGYGVIFKVLNIHNEDELCSTLAKMTFNLMYKNEDTAKDLAEIIFNLWHYEIKRYFISKNQ